jgi:hypothetical protein
MSNFTPVMIILKVEQTGVQLDMLIKLRDGQLSNIRLGFEACPCTIKHYVQKMYKLQCNLVFFVIVSLFTTLNKRISLLQNPYVMTL